MATMSRRAPAAISMSAAGVRLPSDAFVCRWRSARSRIRASVRFGAARCLDRETNPERRMVVLAESGARAHYEVGADVEVYADIDAVREVRLGLILTRVHIEREVRVR